MAGPFLLSLYATPLNFATDGCVERGCSERAMQHEPQCSPPTVDVHVDGNFYVFGIGHGQPVSGMPQGLHVP